jgi:hypothetical protein
MGNNYTYICIDTLVHEVDKDLDRGRIYIHNEAINLRLHLSVPLNEARREMAKLMLRTGKKPDVIGKDDGTDSTMYSLYAFLE